MNQLKLTEKQKAKRAERNVSETLFVRMTKSQYSKLRALADEEGYSYSTFARKLLSQALDTSRP